MSTDPTDNEEYALGHDHGDAARFFRCKQDIARALGLDGESPPEWAVLVANVKEIVGAKDERDRERDELRAALSQATTADIAWCPNCGEGPSVNEDRCCSSCGRDVIVLADVYSMELARDGFIAERLVGIKEAAELCDIEAEHGCTEDAAVCASLARQIRMNLLGESEADSATKTTEPA